MWFSEIKRLSTNVNINPNFRPSKKQEIIT